MFNKNGIFRVVYYRQVLVHFEFGHDEVVYSALSFGSTVICGNKYLISKMLVQILKVLDNVTLVIHEKVVRGLQWGL